MSPDRQSATVLEILTRPRRSLEGRLITSFLTLSLVTLGVVSFVAYRSTQNSIAEALFDQLRGTSTLKEGVLNRWIDARRELLEVIALQPEVRRSSERLGDEGARERLQEIATLMAGNSPDLREVFFMALEGGRVVASSQPGRVGAFHASDLFFTEGRVRSVVQEVYPSPETGRPQITLAVPVRGPDQESLALLAAHLNLDQMDEIVHVQPDLHATAEAYLVTGTNEFVSAFRFGLPEYRRGVHSAGIDSAVAGRTGVARYESYRGVPVIGAYRWIPDRELGLLVEVSQEEAFAPARGLLTRIFLFGLGATLVLLLGVRWIASNVARPVAAVGMAAAKVAGGDFTVVAPERGEDEVGDLARAFNAMTNRLRALYSDLQDQIEVTTGTVSAMEESRSLLRSIVDNSTALIAVTDPEGTIRLMNEAFLHLLGLDSYREAVGKGLGGFLPEEIRDGWMEARRAAFDEERIEERETRWETGSGTRTYLCIWFPLTDGGPSPFGVGMIGTDFTERKRAEEERGRLEAQMRHAQKLESLGVLAGGIAHDFNNILAAILGHAELAAQNTTENPTEVAEHLAQVVAASQRAADLTNQMLAYAGRASFRIETLDLNRAIREMSSFMAVSLPKKVNLETRLSREPLPVRADPAHLSQVVMNLITNAAQAIGDDSGVVEISTIASFPGRGTAKAVLRVRDNGSGMDAETRERIFDPFFTTKETGRGLGLAAVIGIVNGLGGTIEVESEPGEGTTFTVFLPMEGVEEEAASVEAPARAHTAGGGGTILVVDDEEAVRAFTARALELHGLGVLQAEDGLAALEVFDAEAARIDAVVLDLSMPGMGGREVFERLRQESPRLPVVFTSGYNPSDAANVAADTEAVRFLQKPYRPSILVEVVQGLLAEVEG